MISLRKPELVLFDLDGTLVDTVPDLAHSADMMLQQLGMPVRGEEKIRRWVGNGIERLVKRALTDDFVGEPDPALYDRALQIFIDIYAEHTCIHSKPYPGVMATLEYLKENGFHLGCVTNKRGQFTHKLLKGLGIYDDFGIIVSGDTLPKKKPDPLPLLHAASAFSIAPENILMVGDSYNDVLAARAAGCQILCVTYGYNAGQDIRAANPDMLIDTLGALPQLI